MHAGGKRHTPGSARVPHAQSRRAGWVGGCCTPGQRAEVQLLLLLLHCSTQGKAQLVQQSATSTVHVLHVSLTPEQDSEQHNPHMGADTLLGPDSSPNLYTGRNHHCPPAHPPAHQPPDQPTTANSNQDCSRQTHGLPVARHTACLLLPPPVLARDSCCFTQLPVPAWPWPPFQSLQCWRPQPGSRQTPWQQRMRRHRCPS